MMNRHNRKSYLAPPAPRALNRDGSRDSFVNTLPTIQSFNDSINNHNTSSAGLDSGSSGDTHSSRTIPTPTSGDIPVIATQSPPPSSIPTGIAARSPPPPLSLEHLSLETQDKSMPNSHGSRSNRLGFSNRDNIPEPASAIEAPSRPMFPARLNSAHSLSSGAGFTPRNGLQSATMPRRTAPPPTGPPSGPLPPPPGKDAMSNGFGSPRRQR